MRAAVYIVFSGAKGYFFKKKKVYWKGNQRLGCKFSPGSFALEGGGKLLKIARIAEFVQYWKMCIFTKKYYTTDNNQFFFNKFIIFKKFWLNIFLNETWWLELLYFNEIQAIPAINNNLSSGSLHLQPYCYWNEVQFVKHNLFDGTNARRWYIFTYW